MNDYLNFLDINTDYLENDNLYQQDLQTEQLAQHKIAFPQNVQDTIGLPNINNIMDTNIQSNCGMFNPNEGFIRGNMFPNLFDPYKNQKIRDLKPNNEREAMLQDIQKLDFAMKDINLYLDIYPNDNCMIGKFNDYLSQKNKLLDEFQTKYGPITLDRSNSSLTRVPWEWTQTN